MSDTFDSHNTISPSDQLYAELLEEITARVEANESVDVESYIREYPQFSARIRTAVPALQALQSLGVSSVSQTCSTPFKRDSGALRSVTFALCAQIGRGGMGVVFEAEQMSLGRRVALKILPFAALLNEHQLRAISDGGHGRSTAAASAHRPRLHGRLRAGHSLLCHAADRRTESGGGDRPAATRRQVREPVRRRRTARRGGNRRGGGRPTRSRVMPQGEGYYRSRRADRPRGRGSAAVRP